jgi:multiple antibiotic resistance protein
MEHWTEYTRFLTALVVILDPFLAVPIFLGLTAGYDQVQRARVALIVALTGLDRGDRAGGGGLIR